MTKRENLPIIMRADPARGLVPVSSMDAELFDELPRGVDLDVTVKRSKRSLKQLRAYWAGLRDFVKATEAFATPSHCHDEIKRYLGYKIMIPKIGGGWREVTDSTAFDKMDDIEFGHFVDKAQKLILEHYGVDIMARAERKAA